MSSDRISYQQSGYFPPLICDYLNQSDKVKNLYNRFPSIQNFEFQIQEKKQTFSQTHREVLVEVLQQQYKNLNTSTLTQNNIHALSDSNTFTVTTGHQLNLFTGPLYFLYKIISTINLSKQLKSKYPDYNFVPIYWLATEDHDFAEINHFYFKGKKIVWDKESTGGVGRQDNSGLDVVFEVISNQFGKGKKAETLIKMFQEAYLNHNNLADATFYLSDSLFKDEGLVIINADHRAFKRLFIPQIKEELLYSFSEKEVNATINKMKGYAVQVNPRPINLFYLDENLRERILLEEGHYKINSTNLIFSKEEILKELEQFPEKFSPNVLLRPLYQECILPNLAYIGGGGEIAYWLELKSTFERVSIPFPIVMIRDSVVLFTRKQLTKMGNLDLNWSDLFLKSADLQTKKAIEYSSFPLELNELKTILSNQFQYLNELVHKTDKSFLGAVKAQEVKQIKGLENLEKKLLKAQKRKLHDQIERTLVFQNELFPSGNLQERVTNFSEFYLIDGDQLLLKLYKKLNPFDFSFKTIEI